MLVYPLGCMFVRRIERTLDDYSRKGLLGFRDSGGGCSWELTRTGAEDYSENFESVHLTCVT